VKHRRPAKARGLARPASLKRRPLQPRQRKHDRMIRAGQLIKIDVLDHVIIGQATPDRPKAWASLRELGYFYS
jgi:DNA repair protein RadC